MKLALVLQLPPIRSCIVALTVNMRLVIAVADLAMQTDTCRSITYSVSFPDRGVVISTIELLAGYMPHMCEAAVWQQQQQGGQCHQRYPQPLH